MTQPSQMQLIVCQICGSVRVPVPAIVKQQRLTILAANGQPTAEIDPCPVCAMLAKFLEEEEPRVRTIPGPQGSDIEPPKWLGKEILGAREEKKWKGEGPLADIYGDRFSHPGDALSDDSTARADRAEQYERDRLTDEAHA